MKYLEEPSFPPSWPSPWDERDGKICWAPYEDWSRVIPCVGRSDLQNVGNFDVLLVAPHNQQHWLRVVYSPSQQAHHGSREKMRWRGTNNWKISAIRSIWLKAQRKGTQWVKIWPVLISVVEDLTSLISCDGVYSVLCTECPVQPMCTVRSGSSGTTELSPCWIC